MDLLQPCAEILTAPITTKEGVFIPLSIKASNDVTTTDLAASVKQKRDIGSKPDINPAGKAVREGSAHEKRVYLVPKYQSRGPHDILNRANIIKLLKEIPSLNQISSKDIESISFTPSPANPVNEATLVTWASAEFVMAIWKEEKLITSWGIELLEFKDQSYPVHLVTKSITKIGNNQYGISNWKNNPIGRRQYESQQRNYTTSILRGACSTTPNRGSIAATGIHRRDEEEPVLDSWSWIAGVLTKFFSQWPERLKVRDPPKC